MRRVLLGSWQTPSGNGVDVYYDRAATFPAPSLLCAWDREPPYWAPEDCAYYLAVILPALVRRMVEYLELISPRILVLTP